MELYKMSDFKKESFIFMKLTVEKIYQHSEDLECPVCIPK